MSHSMTVTHVQGDQFAVDIRGHRLVVDQPQRPPALEAGPSPLELWVAGLAACVAHFAHLVLARTDPAATVTATCEYEMSDEPPSRVAVVHVALTLPPLDPERLASIRRAVEQCTVSRSLERPPEVIVTLGSQAAAQGTGRAAEPAGRSRREP